MSQVVIGDILPYTQATATGGQTVFMTNWTADTASDVVVYQTPSGNPPNDVTQILPYPAGYSVAFIGGSQEVQVTLVTPASAGDRITITRQTPADRMNLYSNTNFTPSMLNNDFGILTLVDQQAQLVDQKIGPRYNYSAIIVNVVDTILPILGANQTWVKNNANTAIIVYDLPQNGIAPADATYVTITDETSVLPNSVNFAGLSPGLAIFDGTGFVTNPVVGTLHEITVTNGTGVAGSITLSFPDNMIFPGTGSVGLPGGTTGQRVITVSGTPFRYNSTFDSLEFYSNGTWSLINDDTDGTIDIGTIDQFAYYIANGNRLAGIGPLNDEQIFVGQTGTTPAIRTIVQGSGMTIAYGSGTITFSSTGSGGTVTSLTEGAGINLTPDTITTTGSIALAPIATLTGLVNLTGGSLAPSGATLTAWIDAALGSTRGDILYRNATVWTVLAPGTAGFSLQSGGAGADPAYSNTFTNSTLVTPATLGVQQQALNMGTHLINNVVNPVSAQDAATKSYTDSLVGAYLPLAGGTMSGDISLGNAHRVTNALDPSAPQDYATKNYVDQTALTGTSVYAASAGSLGSVTQSGAGVGATLTNAGAQATFALDGVNPPVGQPVLIKNTATGMTAANEGIYLVSNAGSGATNWVLTRAPGYDTATEINNTGLIIVQNGSTLSGSAWYNTSTIVTVDTTNFNFAQFGQTLTNINPNMIFGGNFDTNPWQRGVSFTGVTASSTYMADRWRSASNGAGLYTATKASDAPTVGQAGIFTSTCFQVDITTADASIGAADFYGLRYVMEGYDFAQLAQRAFTLSFWVKSTITGLYSVAFQNTAQDESYIGTYTVNVSDTWEYKTITVPASPSGGTWNYTNGVGCQMYFMMAAGSNYFGTSGAWTASTIYADAAQANAFSSTSNFFKLALVKMEEGTSATAWQVRSEEEEWALCQRYYEKSYNPLNYPGAFGVAGVVGPRWGAVSPGVVPYGIWVEHKVRKCGTAPTVTIYSAGDGSAGNVFVQLIGNSAATVDNSISTGFNISTTAGSYDMEFYWTADSEL